MIASSHFAAASNTIHYLPLAAQRFPLKACRLFYRLFIESNPEPGCSPDSDPSPGRTSFLPTTSARRSTIARDFMVDLRSGRPEHDRQGLTCIPNQEGKCRSASSCTFSYNDAEMVIGTSASGRCDFGDLMASRICNVGDRLA